MKEVTTQPVTDVDAPLPPGPRAANDPARPLLDRVLLCGAVVVATILLGCLLLSLFGILVVRHPNIRYSDNIITDAEAVATGHLQYGNPATQYSGFPYTPLFTWIVAGLLRIFWWVGWAPVVSMVAALAAIVSLVRLTWMVAGTRVQRLASGCFVVALSLGGLTALVSSTGASFSTLEEGRPDQLAWCLLILAASFVFRALYSRNELSGRQMLITGLLLTGAVATKQTTLVPCLVTGVIVLAVPQLLRGSHDSRGVKQWIRSSWTLATFVASSALLGIFLQIASDGQAFDVLVKSQFRYGRIASIGQQTGTSLRLLTIPLIALAVCAVLAVRSMPAGKVPHRRRNTVLAVSVVILAVSPIPTAILAEVKLGGEPNQLVGPVWTLTLGCAVLLLFVHVSARQLAMTAIACGVLLVGIDPVSQILPGHLGVPDLHQTVVWSQIDPFLVGASERGNAVYDEWHPSLSVSPGMSAYPAGDVNDALAEGYTPRLFINNLLNGRYAIVSLFNEWQLGYDSDLGRYDRTVPWKIDVLLKMGYRSITDPVTHGTFFRPTAKLKKLDWFAQCFGPFQARAAGINARFRGYPGLDCIDQGALHQKKSIWPTFNVVATLPRGGGAVGVRFTRMPKTLRVAPLDAGDQATSAPSDVHDPLSSVARCLVTVDGDRTLLMKASPSVHRLKCVSGQNGPILDIPIVGGDSTAHVTIHLGKADSPTVFAVTRQGRPAPFTLLNLTPTDVNSL